MADVVWVEGDNLGIEQQFVLTDDNGVVDLSDATAVTWVTSRRSDDSGSAASTAATILSPGFGYCSVTLPLAHMDAAGFRTARVSVTWAEFTATQWFPSDRALEVLVLPHTHAR